MKHKGLFIATILFFLLVNTAYYWEGNLGMIALLTLFLLILCFLILTFLLIKQIYLSRRENFKDKQRFILIGFMALLLALTFFFPTGLISFEKFDSKSILIAQREGVANCMTTLKLKENKKFIERNVCFGMTETTGTYFIKGDTIFFENVSISKNENDYYKFAVIKNSQNKMFKGDLVRYKDYSDTTGIALWIVKNDLTK